MLWDSGEDDSSSVQRYLDEIAAHPRLDQRTERELGRLIAGDDQAAQEARRRLIEANLATVAEIAARYDGRGLSLLELIQEGNLGLMRAVDNFDHDSGFSFSAAASWWIHQSINRVLEMGAARPAPETAGSVHRLGGHPGGHPTGEEDYAPGAVRHSEPAPPPRALTPVPTQGPDPTAETDAPYERTARELERQALEVQLDRLSPRDQDLLRVRFGIDDTGELTADSVAERYDLTRHRMRQIEERALSKLRHPSTARLWAASQRKTTGT